MVQDAGDLVSDEGGVQSAGIAVAIGDYDLLGAGGQRWRGYRERVLCQQKSQWQIFR
jgi:hypothetical protein